MFSRSLLPVPLLLLLCSLTTSHGAAAANKYIEVTHPLPTDYRLPECSRTVFEVSATFGSSVTSTAYAPAANCSGSWSFIVAELSASIVGRLDKQIAAVWIGGVEILRTSTVQTVDHGAVWKVRKDVTRYSSVLSRSNSSTVSVTLRDMSKRSVSGIFRPNVNGTIHVNVSLLFYGGKIPAAESRGAGNGSKSRKLRSVERNLETLVDENRELGFLGGKREKRVGKLGFPWKLNSQSETTLEKEKYHSGSLEIETGENLRLPSEGRSGTAGVKYNRFYQTPADLIIPISGRGRNGTGSWFVIQNGSDVHSKEIKIPNNTYKAVLEIYVSADGSDEFWYSNPPNTYLAKGNITIAPVNGAFRQVFAAIDSCFVGSVVPFPIVYSEGINPAFWDPVVAIGAFDLPSYDLDLTPFLGLLLDGKSHSISLGVSDSTSFWLVDANLHLWLDQKSPYVTAKLVKYTAPELSLSRKYKFGEEGEFKIEAKRKLEFVGWVNSSHGNLTTRVKNELEFENEIKTKHGGSYKEVEQKIKTETEITVQAYPRLVLVRATYENEYPLKLKKETQLKGYSANSTKIEFSNEKKEKSKVVFSYGKSYSKLENKQESKSTMLAKGIEVVSGEAKTVQKYSYKDERSCYVRSLVAGQGLLLEDSMSNTCLGVEEE